MIPSFLLGGFIGLLGLFIFLLIVTKGKLRNKERVNMKLNPPLELCVELNDLMYELKIILPKEHSLQKRIDTMMKQYQKFFQDL